MTTTRPKRRRQFGTLKTLPSGNIRASYADPRGTTKRYGKTFPARSKGDAEGWLSSVEKSIHHGTWTPPGTKTAQSGDLRAYSKTWLDQRQLKQRTRELYDDLLRLHILPVLGDDKLTAISPATVRTWHAGLSTGPTRKAHAYSLLHAIFVTAVADEIVDANPCRIRSAMSTKTQRGIEPLSSAELGQLASEMPAVLSAAVLLMGWCGLRSGEVKGLRRSDIAPDGSTVTVTRAVTYRSGEYRVDTPKTKAGTRTVSVPPHIRQVIVEHLAENVDVSSNSLLFKPVDDAPFLSDWAFRKPFKKAAEKIGKPQLRVHDLRHTGATLAAQAGATTAELMNRIGHTTPEMAMRYQHVAAGRDAEIARRLSQMG